MNQTQTQESNIEKMIRFTRSSGNTALSTSTAKILVRKYGPINKDELSIKINNGEIERLIAPDKEPVLVSRAASECEIGIARYLRSMAPVALPFRPTCVGLNAAQESALCGLVRAGSGALTGGAGTGKTYVLSRLINEASKHLIVKVAAFSGKAASVIGNKIDVEATTIHRLLGIRTGQMPFYGPHRFLDCDLLILDEASMIDSELMNNVMSALAPETRLILCGDINQIQPIGVGCPFKDIVNNGFMTTFMLKEPTRQAADSGIIRLAYSILTGSPRLVAGGGVHIGGKEIEIEPADWWIRSKEEDRVVIASYKNPKFAGATTSINRAVADKVYGNHKGLKIGERVICIRNDYEYNVFNGEIYTIIDDKFGLIVTDGKIEKEVDRSMFERAYALTVHKAQGSEFSDVMFIIDPGTSMSMELLYTAVTRAKKNLILQGSPASITRNVKREIRVTALPYLMYNESAFSIRCPEWL